MGQFSNGIRQYVQLTKKGIDQQVRGITLSLFKSIIVGTPVDTGRARGNWQTSIGQPITGAIERLDPTGQAALGDVVAKMSGAGGITWLANNLPYIATLEYGGYPNPPKRGTYVPGQGYEIRSEGGFSKQAPAGMVRVNFARIDQIIRSAAAGAARRGT